MAAASMAGSSRDKDVRKWRALRCAIVSTELRVENEPRCVASAVETRSPAGRPGSSVMRGSIIVVMKLEHEACYRALCSRDARFDGHFVTCVLTTGVYCRPICPARTPRQENVEFRPCAAAAEEAGFRPCRRCRPESSPGMPDWMGTSATVQKSLRLISEGALDQCGVEALASRVGVSARHLRRLFLEHIGASPVQVAQTRRLHFAKKLLDETNLSITQIAFNAGYSSVRRFNDAFRKTFACPPSGHRRVAKAADLPDSGSWLQFRLPYRPPFAWNHLLEFLRARVTPGVESVTGNRYRRTIRIADDTGAIEVAPAKRPNELQLRVHVSETRHLLMIVERVRACFDLDSDPICVFERLRSHEPMARLVAAIPGLRVPGSWDGFELAVRAILGQQVSVQAATTLAGRIVLTHGGRIERSPFEELTMLFPTPEQLSNADLEQQGVITSRAEAIRQLARSIASGQISFDASIGSVELSERLCQIPGIGRWTADYISMRARHEPDAFPSSDLGLRKAASQTSQPILPKHLESIAEAWRPWCADAAMYLWSAGSQGLFSGSSG